MPPNKIGVFADDSPVLRPGVYTPAIIANGFVFVSGVLGADPVTKRMVEGSMLDRYVRSPLKISAGVASLPSLSVTLWSLC